MLATLDHAIATVSDALPDSLREALRSHEPGRAHTAAARLTALKSAGQQLDATRRRLEEVVGPGLGDLAWEQITVAVRQGGHTDATRAFDRMIELARLHRRIEREERVAEGTTADLVRDMAGEADRRQELARRLLRIRNAQRLVEAMRDPKVVRAIEEFRSAIRRGRRQYATFERLQRELDYSTLLSVFPAWIMGIDEVCRIFPLRPGLFDVVIVDEASQCHLANSLPLLYRAERAIVVGDEKQLPADTFRFVRAETNLRAMERHGVTGLPRAANFSVRDETLLSLAQKSSGRPSEFLNEHFRSVPAIIAFSNREFYGDRLRVMTDPFAATLTPPLELIELEGAEDDLDRKINQQEAYAVVDHVERLLIDPAYTGKTIGIISPYREQAEEIHRLLASAGIDPEVRRRHQLVASTADGFQGDERDVILYSFRFGPGSSPGVVNAIEGEQNAGPNRFNVAFTRAREQVVTFVSRPSYDFPGRLMRRWIEHSQYGYRSPAADTRPFDPYESPFEAEVAAALAHRGLDVYPQYPCLGFRIDLVVSDGTRRHLAVECDGYSFHTDEFGNQLVDDLVRQEILERAGWTVLRIPSRSWWRNRAAWVETVVETLESLSVDRAATASGEAAKAAEAIELHAAARVWSRSDDGEGSVRAAGTERLRDVPFELSGASRPEMEAHSDREIASHLCEVIEAGRLDEQAIVKETLARLGFRRAGPVLSRRVRSVLSQLVVNGNVGVRDGLYSYTLPLPKIRGQAATYQPIDLVDAMATIAERASSPAALVRRVAEEQHLIGRENEIVLVTALRYALASGRLQLDGNLVGTPKSLARLR